MRKHASPAVTEAFVQQMLTRLQTRPSKGMRVYVLDFRTSELAVLGRRTQQLRRPSAHGGSAGETTTDLEEARSWVSSHYAARLAQELRVKRAALAPERSTLAPVCATPAQQRSSVLTVGDACDAYVRQCEADADVNPNTFRNRRYLIQAHIRPVLDGLPLDALNADLVGAFITGLRVRQRGDRPGQRTGAMAPNTRRALKACLVAVWRASVPGHHPPDFIRLDFPRPNKAAARRRAAFQGDIDALFRCESGAQRPDELCQSLTGAMWYDRTYIESRETTVQWAVPNTAEAMAFQIATGARLEETLLTRWKCIDEAAGTILILGTKSEGGPRWVPYQAQLRPWLDRMRERLRPTDACADWAPSPEHFVFLTNVGDPTCMGSTRSIANRLAHAQRAAGTKRAKKTSHGFRATFASMIERKVSTGVLKTYLGHADAHGGATDRYTEALVPYMPEGHRHLVEHLPSPAAIERLLSAFVPHALPTTTY